MNTKIRNQNSWTWLIAVVMALVLTACGGGGGSSPVLDGPTTGNNTGGNTGDTTGGNTDGNPTTPPRVPVALTVTSSTPADGATGVALNSAPRVAFNSELETATVVAPGAFIVEEDATGNIIDGKVTVSADGMTAVFKPTVSLAANMKYRGTVSTTVKNSDGNTLASPYTWTFTSGSPAADFTYPAAGATAIAVNTKIAAAFTTDINPLTIASPATSFTVKPSAAGAANIAGTVTYDAQSKTAILAPSVNLLPATAYTATLTTAITDMDGNPLASNMTWTFTTGDQSDTTAPTITEFTPGDEVKGVALGGPVTLKFSEAIDPSTITPSSFFVSESSGIHLSGRLEVDTANNQVTFFPEDMLANTRYHIVVKSGVKDLAGNALGDKDPLSHFETGAL